MKSLKFQLLLALMLTIAISASAQNPYAEIEDLEDEYTPVVKFSGQKPTITDFVTAYIGEPEDELTGLMDEIWQCHRKNKPLPKNTKLTVDAKNGFVSMEKIYPDEGDGYGEESTTVDMCYWNCSDGKHKLFAISVLQFMDGKAVQTEFGGIFFGLYNNATHKIIYNNGVYLGMDDIEKESDDAVITYALPRVGKDITATVHNLPNGEKKVLYKWNGLKFEMQK